MIATEHLELQQTGILDYGKRDFSFLLNLKKCIYNLFLFHSLGK